MTEPSEFPFLDSIIDDIWCGRRVLLVPPGTTAFVATNLAFTMGGALWCAEMLPRLLHPVISQPAVAQLLGILTLLPQIVAPGVLVARGAAAGRRSLVLLLTIWSVIAGSSVLFHAMTSRSGMVACSIAFVLFVAARFIVETTSYRVFVVFQQRMRARRKQSSVR